MYGDGLSSSENFLLCVALPYHTIPYHCPDYTSFRIGLFGIGKLTNIDRTVGYFADTLDQIASA